MSGVIQFRLKLYEIDELSRIAAEWGVTKSACAREVISAWLVGDTPHQRHCRGNKPKDLTN
jgi:hypothetical protein